MKFLITLCLLFPLQAMSATTLWQISKAGKTLYIGGTVHVLSPRDYPLPEEFNRAYKQAQKVVFETDLNGMNDPKMQAQWLQRLFYPEGQTLKTHLKPATYQTLTTYLHSVKLPVQSVAQFKPTLVMLTLMMNELQRLGMADSGVDLYFQHQAVADGKAIGQLETVEKQLAVLEKMADGREDEMILSTLNDIKQMPVLMGDLKKAWRTGDLNKLEAIGITPMRSEFPTLYQTVLVERNTGWLPKIEAFLATPETELILVGALHLVGKDGLLQRLQRLGYQVEAFRMPLN